MLRCTRDHQVLVVVDNHASHMSLSVINYCRENGVALLTYPPHTSHRLQPLDISVYGPFKRFYNSAADSWMKSNQGRVMIIYNIPTLVRTALPNAATPRNILAGFESTGIWPFNQDIFSAEDYLPLAVTDRPFPLAAVENSVCDSTCEEESEVERKQGKFRGDRKKFFQVLQHKKWKV